LLGLATIVALATMCGLYYSRDLPRSSPLLWIAFPDDTKFGSGFRESEFVKIQQGTRREQVIARLGEPLIVAEFRDELFVRRILVAKQEVVDRSEHVDPEANADEWRLEYSQPGARFENYHVRTVTIGEDGTVARTHASFYSD
jgi:hypothetical protein